MTSRHNHLVQLFLPVADERGHPFSASVYAALRAELVERFDGLTAWSRSLAEGIWVDDRGRPVRDDIIVYEVMIGAVEAEWWGAFRRRLEAVFRQDSIVIRVQDIRQL